MDAPTLGPSIASVEDLRTLLRMRDEPVVSIYAPQDEVTQLLKAGLHTLRKRNGSRDDAFAQIADRIRSERIDVQRSFAAENGPPAGIACFITPMQAIRLSLPMPVPTRLVRGEAPFLEPLLALFRPSYVVGLYLSPHGAHAFHGYGDWRRHRPIGVSPPAAMSPERSSDMSSKGPVLGWLHAVDRCLDPILPCRHHPIVLMGMPALIEAYASVNVHRSVISGDPLAAGACPDADVLYDMITAKARDDARRRMAGDLRALRETRTTAPKRYVDDAHTILEEAAARRVDTLFVHRARAVATAPRALARALKDAPDRGGDGAHEPAPQLDVASPDLDGRIEAAMAHTIISGGTVHEVTDAELPATAPVTAVLRY
ncbi:hypothetical protein [Longibacter sp.]|uniref:hypothetical protein n=1 Tax=Longibacter sp. TaxID=2045415 RepID=UPI003EBDD688